MTMLLTDAIEKRRSIRKYTKSNITVEELKQIIKAGTDAPSAKNRQPWFFYILHEEDVKSKFIHTLHEGIDKLSHKYEALNIIRPDINSANKTIECMRNADALILVAHQKKYGKSYEDGVCWDLFAKDIEVTDILSIGAAVQNMLLKATEMGYGTLWVCDIFYAYPQLIDFLQTDNAILSVVCIGKAAEQPVKRPRLSVEAVSSFIHKEKT